MKAKECHCQVEGCSNRLPAYATYYQRYRICAEHAAMPELERNGRQERFCQQCGRFHELAAFDGVRKTCRRKLQMHNAQRKRARDAARLAASEPASPASSSGITVAPRRKSHDISGTHQLRSHAATDSILKGAGESKPTSSAADAAMAPQAGPSFHSSTSTMSEPNSAGELVIPRPRAPVHPLSTADAAVPPAIAAPIARMPDPALAMSMDLDAILGVDLNALLPVEHPSGMEQSTGMEASLPLEPLEPPLLTAGAWRPPVNLPAPMVAQTSDWKASGSGVDAVATGLGLPVVGATSLPTHPNPTAPAPAGPVASAHSLRRQLPFGISERVMRETSVRMFGVGPQDLPPPLYEALMSVLKSSFISD